MAWATDAEIKAVLRGILAKANVATVSDRWTPILTQANTQARMDITTIMIARGYTPSQIVAWEFTNSFHVRQSLYWALVFGAALHPYEDRFIEKLDIREMLESVTVTDGDTIVPPALLGTIASVGDMEWDGLGLNFAPENEATIRLGMQDIGEREY